jgi:hypothetical protein
MTTAPQLMDDVLPLLVGDASGLTRSSPWWYYGGSGVAGATSFFCGDMLVLLFR